jgi:hypothetical protein
MSMAQKSSTLGVRESVGLAMFAAHFRNHLATEGVEPAPEVFTTRCNWDAVTSD